MAKVKAIVLDSNVFGSLKTPNMALIEKWARSCSKNSVELWIPEVVLHELTQHAIEEEEKHLEKFRIFSAFRQRMGFPPLAPIDRLDPIDVRKRIEETGAHVIELSAESAREGLLDQIYLRGAGERKGVVKTGAADSAWIRSVAEAASARGWRFSDLVVVSGDKHAVEQGIVHVRRNDIPLVFPNVAELGKYLDDGSGEIAEDVLDKFCGTSKMELEMMSPETFVYGSGINLEEYIALHSERNCSALSWDSDLEDVEVSLDEFSPWLGVATLNSKCSVKVRAEFFDVNTGEHSQKSYRVTFEGAQSASVDGQSSYSLSLVMDNPKVTLELIES